ncbi:MAG TPA: NUDIX hydrolase [Actinospica sp.]|jgi:8-oxo-dGTP pyrophosphatase MutT (NUDIX family)|nr:NUDIX hydrolase [Actinospica sp.]
MDAFLAGLPAVYVGVGGLIGNPAGEILIVKPTYKPGWEIPGGGMDADEYPRETLRRELAEEIGFTLEPGRLLAVDFSLARPQRPRPSIMYVYDCGVLDARQQARITLPLDELSEHRFVAPEALGELLPGRLARRVLEAVRQRDLGGTADQENGFAPGSARLARREAVESLD